MAKIDKFQIKRGNESNLPSLDIAEPGFTTDSEKLYIGGNSGNIEMSRKIDLTSHGDNYLSHNNKEKFVRSDKDLNGVFLIIEKYRADDTKFYMSVLSGGESPAYTTRTEMYYAADGITIVDTIVYTLVYDGDGVFVSETPN